MTPYAITRLFSLFKEAYDTFPPLEGKPTDDDLLAIRETLLPLLMVIPCDQLNGLHSLTAILMEATKYEATADADNSRQQPTIKNRLGAESCLAVTTTEVASWR